MAAAAGGERPQQYRTRRYPVRALLVPFQDGVLRGMFALCQQNQFSRCLPHSLLFPAAACGFSGHLAYPFDPIARSKVYLSASPTASGPEIVAVAISGYACARIPRTSSTLRPGAGSSSLTPFRLNTLFRGVTVIAVPP